MDYLTDLTFPSQNSDRFFQKYLILILWKNIYIFYWMIQARLTKL